jgi:Uma2 family endonuclease
MSPAAIQQPFPRYANAGFFRLSVAQYHDMIRNHTLTPDDKVELLRGYLVNKMPQGTTHSTVIEGLGEDLFRVLPAGWRVRGQLPITLADSEPEPDFAIVRGVRGAFAQRHPGAGDFGIVIEVADSSLLHDRREKGELYAEAGIPVYWVVNVVDRQIEVYANPQPAANPPEYATRTDYPHSASVPVVLDGVTVATLAVADLIP